MLAPLEYDTLDHFIAWLETKDPNETFNLALINECALGQYDRAYGRKPVSAVSIRFKGLGIEIIVGRFSDNYCHAERYAYQTAIPFGDVLERAKAIRGY